MRRFLTGIFVLATASAAHAQKPPAQVVINHAPAGISIDIYMDAGKVRTATVNQQGTTAIELDFLSLGKPQGQIYIETCKDGQRIRIVSDGTTVATDDGCHRKPVGVLFTLTCTKKITINFVAAKASFAGCGSIFTNTWVLGAIGAGVGTVAITSAGGSDNSTGVVQQAPTIPVVNIPSAPVNQTPVTAAPPAPVTAPTAPVTVTINPSGTWRVGGCSLGPDPRQHELVVQLCRIPQFIVDASGTGFDITAPGTPFPRFGGPLNTTTGSWQLTASNTVGGSVPATWVGSGTFATTTANMTVVMTVTVNGITDSVTYTFTLTKS